MKTQPWKIWALSAVTLASVWLGSSWEAQGLEVTTENPYAEAVISAEPSELSDSSDLLLSKSSKKSSTKKSKKSKTRKKKKSPQADVPSKYCLELSQVPTPQPGTLRVATWNVHDLFDATDDSYQDVVLTPKQLSGKLDALSKVLNGVKADIVGIEEVENEACLQALANRAHYPYYKLLEGNDKVRGIDVAVLSRIPIKNCVTHKNDPCMLSGDTKKYRFSRDCLEVHFKLDSNLCLLVNHFKSKARDYNGASDTKRLAQATQVQKIAKGLDKMPVVIVGDLNDEPDSKALKPLLKSSGLHDTLNCIPKAERITYKNKKYNSALDYIIGNDKFQKSVVADSPRIVIGAEVSQASDHRPVYVDIRR